MVFTRTKCNRLDLIRNLNLWGNDLSQLGALQLMPNLEVLSLSVNRIDNLADLRFCPKLAELYLRKNSIADLAEVQQLRSMRHLKVLWLSDNPCATLPDYRTYVLHHLPGLVKLDSLDVTDEERKHAARADVGQMETFVEQDFDAPLRGDSQGERGPPQGDMYISDQQAGLADIGAARADNILCAVLALIKELDQQGLELVRR